MPCSSKPLAPGIRDDCVQKATGLASGSDVLSLTCRTKIRSRRAIRPSSFLAIRQRYPPPRQLAEKRRAALRRPEYLLRCSFAAPPLVHPISRMGCGWRYALHLSPQPASAFFFAAIASRMALLFQEPAVKTSETPRALPSVVTVLRYCSSIFWRLSGGADSRAMRM